MEVTLTFGYGDVFFLGVFTGVAFCFIAWLIKELKDD